VIVGHFNVGRTRIHPTETDPILVIDPDAVLTLTISSKRLQGWCTVIYRFGDIRPDSNAVAGPPTHRHMYRSVRTKAFKVTSTYSWSSLESKLIAA
jgi:hypothetical protein